MGDTARELAEGLHLLRLDQLFLGLLQLQLGFALLGHVARDLGVAEQPPLHVPDRIDQHAGPEHRAVLAHPPAFSLVLALGQGLVQRLDRHAGPPVSVGVELGEVQADDLVGGIALDPLSAGVPVRDHAVGIEHDQGAVVDALHEHPELALALQQRLLGGLPLGDVAGDVDEADDLAVIVANRLQHGLRPEAAAVATDAPALALEAAAGEGRFKRTLGEAPAAILLVVEKGEAPADDLVGWVAGDPLGAGIPGGHLAAPIQQENGVVGDRVQEHLEAPVLRNGLQRLQLIAPSSEGRPWPLPGHPS